MELPIFNWPKLILITKKNVFIAVMITFFTINDCIGGLDFKLNIKDRKNVICTHNHNYYENTEVVI